MKSFFPFKKYSERLDIFEFIYFSKPNSILKGHSVYEIRKKFGIELSKEYNNIKADVIIPIPDSGIPAAIGYSQNSGIPFELGIIRSHYIGRTFIDPTQAIRNLKAKLKHSIIKSQIKNKKIILIDDSLVRGTTIRKIINLINTANPKEVHLCLSSPPIKYADYYGINTPSVSELLAAKYNIKEIKNYLKLDSINFLSLNGLYKALGYQVRNNYIPQFTDHYFTGDYPTKLTDLIK